jgi:thiol-disulfide isomerase/thioredoxin
MIIRTVTLVCLIFYSSFCFADIKPVVLIFHPKADLGDKQKKKFFVLKNTTRLQYLDDHHDLITLQSHHKSEFDTIRLITTREKLYLTHAYYEIEQRFHYEFLRGDTVDFKYDGDYPVVTVRNRKVMFYDLNSNYFLSKRFGAADVDLGSRGLRSLKANEKETYLRKIVDNYRLRQFVLDSLYRSKSLSTNAYHRHTKNCEYRLNEIGLSITDADRKFLLNQEISFNKLNDSDSLLSSLPFANLLLQKTRNRFGGNVIEQGKSIKVFNFKTVFDSVARSTEFSQRIRDFLLVNYLNEIRENFTLADFDKYYRKSLEIISDKSLADYIRKSYLSDMNAYKKKADSVFVIDYSKHTSSFIELLQVHKGKVVYVDLWASWCGPCRAVMPQAKQLSSAFPADQFTMLFLSTDEIASKWERAVAEEELQFTANNFLVLNPKSARFFKEIGIDYLPRYLIFDRAGKLIHKNAPGPSDPFLRELIQSLIAN